LGGTNEQECATKKKELRAWGKHAKTEGNPIWGKKGARGGREEWNEMGIVKKASQERKKAPRIRLAGKGGFRFGGDLTGEG